MPFILHSIQSNYKKSAAHNTTMNLSLLKPSISQMSSLFMNDLKNEFIPHYNNSELTFMTCTFIYDYLNGKLIMYSN